MEESDNIAVNGRRLQEELANAVNAGIFTIAKFNKLMYDAYIEAGFTNEQALYLIKVDGKKS